MESDLYYETTPQDVKTVCTLRENMYIQIGNLSEFWELTRMLQVTEHLNFQGDEWGKVMSLLKHHAV
jgi:hypothetical protein